MTKYRLLEILLTVYLSPVFTHDCDVTLMDSLGVPVIDKTELEPGYFDRITLNFCTMNPVEIQIWRYSPGNREYELVYVQNINPQDSFTAPGFLTFSVAPHTVIPGEYLALYSEMSTRIPIPYSETPNGNGQPWMSAHLPAGSYTLGDKLPVSWEDRARYFYRIFVPSVYLCERLPCGGVNTPTGGLGQKGEPGPRGMKGDKGLMGPPGAACDFSADDPLLIGGSQLPGDVADVKNGVDNIENLLREVGDQINNLRNIDQTSAGSCSAGFTPGKYGVGYCYIMFLIPPGMQFGESGMACYENYQGSSLLTIESSNEEKFLAEFITNTTRLTDDGTDRSVTVWTGGMWSNTDNTWIWYQEGRNGTAIDFVQMSSTQEWLNWGPSQPTDHTGKKKCIAFKVFNNGDHFWYNEDCSNRRLFVCKKPKKCN